MKRVDNLPLLESANDNDRSSMGYYKKSTGLILYQTHSSLILWSKPENNIVKLNFTIQPALKDGNDSTIRIELKFIHVKILFNEKRKSK